VPLYNMMLKFVRFLPVFALKNASAFFDFMISALETVDKYNS